MANFYITGTSGVGKSTVVKELNARGIFAYDIDAVPKLCHWRNKATGIKADWHSGIGRDWLEAHEWICDEAMLKKMLKNDAVDTVIAGLAFNQNDFLNLFDKIILLHCEEKTFLHRLDIREGEDAFAKDKSEQKYLLSWYREYEEEMVRRGAISINTEDPLEVVVEKIITEIKSI
jgi:dephospho-CoA kinase